MGSWALPSSYFPTIVQEDDLNEPTLLILLVETRRQVEAAVKDGLSLDDTRKRVDLKRFRLQLAGEDYWRGRAFDEFYLQPAVAQAYKEAKGEVIEEDAEG